MANLDYISHQTLVDSAGVPYANAKINYYETGTTTPKTTYSNAGLTSANTNPVVANSAGVVPAVYLLAGRYKRTVTTSAGVSLSQFDVDPLDASLELIAAAAAPSPTYPFLRYHNTTDGHVYRRDSTNASWIDEGPVDSLGGAATVTQQLAGTSTAVYSTPDSVAGLWQRGTDITPSAGAVSLPSTGGGVFNINAGNFSSISAAQGGRQVLFVFAGASTITHNATSMILPGAANITTVAGDWAVFTNEAAADASGSNWRCTGGRFFATQAQMETASITDLPVSPGRQHFHPGHPKWWGFVTVAAGTPTLQSSYNLTSITDTGVGILTATIANDLSSVNWAPFVTVQWTGTGPTDTTQFTTGVRSGSIAAGSVAFDCTDQQAAQAYADPASWSIFGLGDI